MLREALNGVLRMHLFLSSPENSCRPISAMTARKNKNKTKTSLKSFKERSKVFTIARRPEKGNERVMTQKWSIVVLKYTMSIDSDVTKHQLSNKNSHIN